MGLESKIVEDTQQKHDNENVINREKVQFFFVHLKHKLVFMKFYFIKNFSIYHITSRHVRCFCDFSATQTVDTIEQPTLIEPFLAMNFKYTHGN